MQRRLRSALREQPAAALLGPRQVGKGALAQALGATCFDLEIETERLGLDLEWERLVRAKGLVVLDEAPVSAKRGAGREVRRRHRLEASATEGAAELWARAPVAQGSPRRSRRRARRA